MKYKWLLLVIVITLFTNKIYSKNTLEISGLWFIRLFQTILSPQDGPHCRYNPTCSQYGKLSIQRFGIIKGSIITADRLLRCNPLGRYGKDPVPKYFIQK